MVICGVDKDIIDDSIIITTIKNITGLHLNTYSQTQEHFFCFSELA